MLIDCFLKMKKGQGEGEMEFGKLVSSGTITLRMNMYQKGRKTVTKHAFIISLTISRNAWGNVIVFPMAFHSCLPIFYHCLGNTKRRNSDLRTYDRLLATYYLLLAMINKSIDYQW